MADNKNVSGIRYSAIQAMHSCKLNAWLIYVMRMEGKQNKFATMGIAIHDILEEYASHCFNKKLDTDFTHLEIIKYKHYTKLEEDQFKEANTIISEIKNNFNFNSLNAFNKVFIEKRFYLDRDFNPATKKDFYLSSGIDLVYCDDDTAYVEDYKTSRSIYTKSFMEESLQKKTYELQIYKHLPEINTINFAFNFVRYGYKADWIISTREESLEAIENQLRAECNEYEELTKLTEPPEATPSSFCMLCPVSGTCKAYQNAFDDFEKISDVESAKKLYQQLLLGKNKIKTMETQLKWWIEHNTPLEFKNETYGPQVYESTKFEDPRKLINILTEVKIPEGAIDDVITIGKGDVDKIIKRFKLEKKDQEKILSVATKGKTTKFVAKKKEEEKSDEDGSFDPYL